MPTHTLLLTVQRYEDAPDDPVVVSEPTPYILLTPLLLRALGRCLADLVFGV